MRRFLKDLFSAPFQLVLVISFSLVSATTIAVGTYVISRTIRDYLAEAMTERVNRDMHLAETLYQIKLRDVAGIAHRLALDPIVTENLAKARAGDAAARTIIDRQIANKITVLALGGNHFIAVLDADGNVLAGRLVSGTGEHAPVVGGGNWAGLPIVKDGFQNRQTLAATEVISSDMLAQIGLAEQAGIAIIDTPKAAKILFDPREGRAGLALVGISPIYGEGGETVGAAVAFHLFNNDFTLVDEIKDAAGIDTVTIFFGDLRVSTNVLTQDGKRAIGTRISEEVSQVVLGQGREFTGPAFVVNENYITRYDPLRDHAGQVIGSLYVGVRQASFLRLVNTVNERVLLVALAMILATFLLATPISRTITRPLKELKELAAANRRVAAGDMAVRVPVRAGGEVGQLARSFNQMLDTLQATQDQLVHSEKLASLGQLAAGVAHELNNPLATVLLYSDILLKESAPGDPRRADLTMIVNETKRCKGIVAALLDFARQNQVAAEPTDLNALIRNVVEVEQKRDAFAAVKVATEFDPTLPIIQADPAQMHEVFVNLMTNGVEAMPDGGALTLRTRSGPSGMVTIEISDTGVGIPPEHQSKLFTPFFTTKPIGHGTGLGLAIIYGIIKMHRGQ
ncbi:MAG: cache domain-containing protein, partial [Chloroflexi bacterium]|nr:cache domain-containing protein [Chloroflexota bacterium]